jgi:hypothetical protein
VNELAREWGTHLHAVEAEWEFPASYGDVMALTLAQGFVTVHRDPKKPVTELTAPWGDGKPRFTPEEIEAAERQLAARSAIR